MDAKMTKQLTNAELRFELIPDPAQDSFRRAWHHFAITLNGYEASGGSRECAEVAHKVWEKPEDATLTELRIALFFKQRAERFTQQDRTELAAVLVRLIRAKVLKGDL